MSLHRFLDLEYSKAGEEDELTRRLADPSIDLEAVEGDPKETPLLVAVRRRRLDAVRILLDAGAKIDARNGCGKTSYAHSKRRGFTELVELLEERGASTKLSAADEFAVAVAQKRLDDARTILAGHPHVIRTGNPEEDRLLADMSGRPDHEDAIRFLIEAGADLSACALDSGTPLHQASWFGQPQNARLLIDAGAPLDVFDSTHNCSAIGWAVHGSRFSGGAEDRQPIYAELVQMLLKAGSSLNYPSDDSNAYLDWMKEVASEAIRPLLKNL